MVQSLENPQTKLMTGAEAVATAAKLSRPQVIAAYPITPQTKIVETLSGMVARGEMDTEYINVESEHSAMGAVIGASLAGTRTFTATSSHGLLYMGELVWWAGMTRIPVVMPVVNRSLNPWNIWPDHQDAMTFRDAGWIQFYAKNNQEVLDLTICAFKIAEHHKIWMPVMVCLDGFILSHTSAQVEVPSQKKVDNFLPPFEPLAMLDPDNPFAHGSLTDSEGIWEQRMSLIDGFNNAHVLIPQIFTEYTEKIGRLGNYLIEVTGDIEHAECAVIALGTLGEEAEQTVEYLLEKNIKAVVLRPRVFRPFPKKELIVLINKVPRLLVIDRAVSFGNAGQLAIEIQAELFAHKVEVKFHQKIMGLGGMDVNYVDIATEIERVLKED
ncbi:pyruvate ferredoxin oxidoreductase [Candidatus Heimdallarchaeota archaeon B3_Heim]|nr:MAG: pyruvate ferredoxin oxidoreductase [Candidatus Heimdallarchaeota archaeon B3_Heim]